MSVCSLFKQPLLIRYLLALLPACSGCELTSMSLLYLPFCIYNYSRQEELAALTLSLLAAPALTDTQLVKPGGNRSPWTNHTDISKVRPLLVISHCWRISCLEGQSALPVQMCVPFSEPEDLPSRGPGTPETQVWQGGSLDTALLVAKNCSDSLAEVRARQQAAPCALTAYLGSAVLSLTSSYSFTVMFSTGKSWLSGHQSSEWGLQHHTEDSKALLASRGLWCILVLPAGKSTSSLHYRKHMRAGAVNWKCSQMTIWPSSVYLVFL